MKLLFLIGVEGTGHHMIRAVLADHLKRDDVIDEGPWHKPLIDHWDPSSKFKVQQPRKFKLQPRRKLPTSKSLKKELERIFHKYRRKNITHLFESASFPYCQPRDSLRRPDILDFFDIVHNLIDVRYLILYRNEISVTYSGFRRFTNNIYLQMKIVESNFSYIERQFSQLPLNVYKTLCFEYFLSNPLSYVDGGT